MPRARLLLALPLLVGCVKGPQALPSLETLEPALPLAGKTIRLQLIPPQGRARHVDLRLEIPWDIDVENRATSELSLGNESPLVLRCASDPDEDLFVLTVQGAFDALQGEDARVRCPTPLAPLTIILELP